MLKYTEHLPQAALRDYIVCFWSMVSSLTPSAEVTLQRILPDCCADIIFDFKGARNHSSAFVVGTMTRPICFSGGGTVDMLGIRFKPGAARSFLQVPIQECTDLTADLECFWGHDGGGLLDRMAGMPDTHARIAVLENHILSKFGCSMGVDPYVQHCVKVIESGHGIVPMHILEKGTGIGARQIERKFMRDIGIGPKAYSRIVRFLSIIQHAKTAARPDWSGLAATHAYSDQSHLVREFKEFSGLTPSAFIAPQ